MIKPISEIRSPMGDSSAKGYICKVCGREAVRKRKYPAQPKICCPWNDSHEVVKENKQA